MDNDSLQDELLDILSGIKLLTGALLHDDYVEDGGFTGMFQKQLAMLKMFLLGNDRFAMLTTGEIMHAFHLNQQGMLPEVYKHYNKELNAEFIGDVLLGYLKYKKALYEREGKLIKGVIDPPPAAPIIRISSDQWKQYIQQDYEAYRAGAADMIFNTSPKYFFLRKCALIQYTNRGKWQQWYRSALEAREWAVKRRPVASEGQRMTKDRDMEAYEIIRQTGMITRAEHNSVLHLMRRMVYLKFFEMIAGLGYRDIFSEIQFENPDRR